MEGQMSKIVITSAVRSAIGNFGGALRTIPAYDIAAPILNETVKRSTWNRNLSTR